MKKQENYLFSRKTARAFFVRIVGVIGVISVLTIFSSNSVSAFSMTALDTLHQVEQNGEYLLSGKIVDKKNNPITGATVVVLGTTNGSITDNKGAFALSVKNGQEIEVTYVGMKTTIYKVVGSANNIVIKLEDNDLEIEEVVVVGYGTTAVRDLTGSVARIGAKEIGVKNVTSASSLIQNMSSGVMVSQASGKPGEGPRIRVRGATSLTGSNDPLYVIDGVPTDDPTMFDAIPPSDISSIDILKDASASAIYGSRAANGVILVTTKQGGFGRKPTFNVDYTASLDTQIKNFDMLDGDQFRFYLKNLANQTLLYNPSNETAKLILDPNSDYVGGANTDWFNLVKQPALRHDLNVSTSGGGENVSYYISGSIQDQKGMIKNDDLTRYVGRVNLDANITSWFRMGAKVTATYIDQSNSGTSLHSAQGYRPDLPVYNEDGSFFFNSQANPVAMLNEVNNSDSYRFLGTIYGELEFLKDLKFKSSLSANQSMGYDYTFTPSYLMSNKIAEGYQSSDRSFTTIWDNTLTYKKDIKKHSFDALIGLSFENQESQNSNLRKKRYALDEIYTNVTSGADYSSASDDKSGRGLLSSFFRANYKYNDKYLVTFTARYDGSSMFGKNNRYGFFPSGALAWRINQESFLKNVKAINDIKLKVSAGRTGVQNMSNYSNRDLYSTVIYNGKPGIVHTQIGNNDIQWEQSTLYDAALDYAFFGHRLTGSVGYYVKNTEGLIWSYNFPSSMAVSTMNRNIGSVQNKGIEFNIRGVIVDKEDLSLTLSLNLSHNKNMVTKLETDGAFTDYKGNALQGSTSQVLAVGYPMGSFVGYEHNGIIQSLDRVNQLNEYASSIDSKNTNYDGKNLFPGMLEYRDTNGDGKISADDRTIIGSPDPDLFGGFLTQFKYKSFSLDLDFGFQIGGQKNYSKALQNVPAQLTGLVDYNLYNAWSPTNMNSKVPTRYLEEGVARTTDMTLFDTSYLRLQNLRIGYDLPKFGKSNISATIYVNAANLFTITKFPGMDPATISSTPGGYGGNYDGGYPGIRTFSFGAKLNF